MPLNLFYTMVQKSQKWPKTQIKGACLNSWTKMITKIANSVLEKRQLRRNVPIFETKAVAVRKLKGKEEHRETANLMCDFYRKPMEPRNFDGILYQLRHWFFSHGFHQKIRSNRNQKVIFVKSPISSPIDSFLITWWPWKQCNWMATLIDYILIPLHL